MIPTLTGRYQTRIFLVLFIASIWTAIVSPFLPSAGMESFTDLYPATFLTLGIVLALGLVLWEWFFYILQLMRWEKDWPAMFFMLQLIPEAILAWYVFKEVADAIDLVSPATRTTFIWHIVSTWIVMWLFVLGPIKIFLVKWRFNGGRIFW